MTKMLANRLKKLLPKLISESQSAFVPCRSIQDNCILAFEVMHSFHCRTRGKEFSAALKMYISKAYDRMEWSFVKDILCKFGFSPVWVDLIYRCLSTISYWILQNGKQIGPIVPTRGLRAEDSEERTLKHILLAYEQASGQEISLQKSSITFSANTPASRRDLICNTLGVEEKDSLGCYLGLPSHVGRKKREVFGYLKDRIWRKVSSWKDGMLSRAGKEILLKTVLQAMPSYVMSLFLLPKTLCSEIEGIMNKFWWESGGANSKGIHWLAWEHMAYPKGFGGMGFKRLREFNVSLLGKQGWNIISRPNA
ncbi:uncharacterized protein LOC105646435 [Jatropha curcas]|uniref:uncharacterized protein LOC105646435 n=1 Tax=Jatropha curcas TaxID=180498 RepID=UPI0005FBEE63|nr:uncharacterized protein LOC105646435 [Jatropha curcas]